MVKATQKKSMPKEVTMELNFNIKTELTGKPRNQRSAMAVRAIKRHARKVMGTTRVRIEPELNKFVWSQGIHNPPKKVRLLLKRQANPDFEDWDKTNKFMTVVGFKLVPSLKGLHTKVYQEEQTA
ncbi:hypothetical protein ABK040_009566 [Willaertia magna]